jgi:hypothetical protein
MAQVDFGMPTPVALPGKKPKTSIYTTLLIIALVALLIGCLTLYLEIKAMGGFGTIRGKVASMTTPAVLSPQVV